MNNMLNKEEFYQYLFSGEKISIDKINNILAEDIMQNKKEAFLEKWNLFLLKNLNLEQLNFNRIWFNLIEKNHTDWLEEFYIPVNKYSFCIYYASRKYYLEMNPEDQIKNREVLYFFFGQIAGNQKSKILKEFEMLKNNIDLSLFGEEKDKKNYQHYLKVILDIDVLYRSLKPSNPDKFLTQMIITQGKKIEVNNYIDGYKQLLINNDFFNNVTIKLMNKLMEFDAIGVNKLKNKKDSQSLNGVYHFFKKYYEHHKLNNILDKNSEKIKIKKTKI